MALTGSQFNTALGVGGLGALGSALGGLFGGNSNPADAGMPYLNQIQQQLGPMFNPYLQSGQGALGQLPGLYNGLLNNPAGVMNQIGSTYHQSPGFQFQLNQGLNAANNAAAAGGMLGSPQHQQQAATIANGLANQDYYNYLQQGLGLYGQGLQGTQGLAGMGLNAAGEYGTDLGNALMSQAQLAYAGQAAQNQANGGLFGGLFGGLGALGSLGGLF